MQSIFYCKHFNRSLNRRPARGPSVPKSPQLVCSSPEPGSRCGSECRNWLLAHSLILCMVNASLESCSLGVSGTFGSELPWPLFLTWEVSPTCHLHIPMNMRVLDPSKGCYGDKLQAFATSRLCAFLLLSFFSHVASSLSPSAYAILIKLFHFPVL